MRGAAWSGAGATQARASHCKVTGLRHIRVHAVADAAAAAVVIVALPNDARGAERGLSGPCKVMHRCARPIHVHAVASAAAVAVAAK
jgi:hypothetical protein